MSALNLWNDFKKFAFKGNLIDLAVAVVLGGAFGAVVNSLVSTIIMPLVSYVMPVNGSYHEWHLGRIQVGTFLGAFVNFLIVAFAMFLIVVKLLGTMKHLVTHHHDEPATKECPYCISIIPARAVKCSQCTADLPRENAEAEAAAHSW